MKSPRISDGMGGKIPVEVGMRVVTRSKHMQHGEWPKYVGIICEVKEIHKWDCYAKVVETHPIAEIGQGFYWDYKHLELYSNSGGALVRHLRSLVSVSRK